MKNLMNLKNKQYSKVQRTKINLSKSFNINVKEKTHLKNFKKEKKQTISTPERYTVSDQNMRTGVH